MRQLPRARRRGQHRQRRPRAQHARTRRADLRPGHPPEEYIRESIVDPNAYVVKGFRPAIMPQDYAKRLSRPELDALVAYLKAQGG